VSERQPPLQNRSPRPARPASSSHLNSVRGGPRLGLSQQDFSRTVVSTAAISPASAWRRAVGPVLSNRAKRL
jgi:hypothetical protein